MGCEGTTGRRQMAWYPGKNYGWCSMAAGFLVGVKSDTADYCDASQSEPPDGKGSATSNCCVVHDKCLSCTKPMGRVHDPLGLLPPAPRVCRGDVVVSSRGSVARPFCGPSGRAGPNAASGRAAAGRARSTRFGAIISNVLPRILSFTTP